MREILFRGKQIDTGALVEGAFCMKDCDDPFGELVDRPSIIKYEEPHSGYWFRVDPETVGQFTGLTDKNGKKIFEGDIVEVNHEAYPGVRGEVFFKNGSFMLKNVSDVLSLYGFLPWCKVIGNIHDNPELLEEDK